MSVNIEAILALFPDKKSGERAPDASSTWSATIRGKMSFDDSKDAFDEQFVAVVESIQRDARWGPIYRGELQAYNQDHSKADLALCGEFARRGLGAGGIDTAMRSSELYREKWERDDYRTNTIDKALEGVDAQRPTPETSHPPPARKFPDLSGGRIDVKKGEPEPRDWVVDGLMLAGKSVVEAGFGGTSKTQLAVQLAAHIALGKEFAGRAVKPGNVMLLLGEEDTGEISRRVSAFVRRQSLAHKDVEEIVTRIRAFGLIGEDMRLTVREKGGLMETGFANVIIAAAKARGDVRLIVLDHIGLVHGGDFNAREDAGLTMRVVNHIATETGAAVLALAHSPKSAVDINKDISDATMVAGSTAFVDQARGAWVLATMREGEATTYGVEKDSRHGYTSLTIVKNNYGPTGDVLWFERVAFGGTGLLEPVTLVKPEPKGKKPAVLETRIEEFVKAHPGQYSKTGLRDSKSGLAGVFKASKAEVAGAIETLIGHNRLVNRPPTPEERATFDHNARIKHVLDVWRPKEA